MKRAPTRDAGFDVDRAVDRLLDLLQRVDPDAMRRSLAGSVLLASSAEREEIIRSRLEHEAATGVREVSDESGRVAIDESERRRQRTADAQTLALEHAGLHGRSKAQRCPMARCRLAGVSFALLEVTECLRERDDRSGILAAADELGRARAELGRVARGVATATGALGRQTRDDAARLKLGVETILKKRRVPIPRPSCDPAVRGRDLGRINELSVRA